jgi:hypothetical protein
MTATPRELLDTSIAQLQMLTAFLGDQLADSAVESKSSDTPEIVACREILVSLAALMAKAQATTRLTSARASSGEVRPGERWSGSHANRGVSRRLTVREVMDDLHVRSCER